MANNGEKRAPSQGRKDAPTADRDHRNASSNEELSDRTTKRGATPGAGGGRRNGSSKHR